ncbi:MAG: hypothetical protein Q8P01_05610 [bacterium]|nr:hypothetical protein [bacterium]
MVARVFDKKGRRTHRWCYPLEADGPLLLTLAAFVESDDGSPRPVVFSVVEPFSRPVAWRELRDAWRSVVVEVVEVDRRVSGQGHCLEPESFAFLGLCTHICDHDGKNQQRLNYPACVYGELNVRSLTGHIELHLPPHDASLDID